MSACTQLQELNLLGCDVLDQHCVTCITCLTSLTSLHIACMPPKTGTKSQKSTLQASHWAKKMPQLQAIHTAALELPTTTSAGGNERSAAVAATMCEQQGVVTEAMEPWTTSTQDGVHSRTQSGRSAAQGHEKTRLAGALGASLRTGFGLSGRLQSIGRAGTKQKGGWTSATQM
jgi:hypothetical protein